MRSELEHQVMIKWCDARDTCDIALSLGLPQSQVANVLARILDADHDKRTRLSKMVPPRRLKPGALSDAARPPLNMRR